MDDAVVVVGDDDDGVRGIVRVIWNICQREGHSGRRRMKKKVRMKSGGQMVQIPALSSTLLQ